MARLMEASSGKPEGVPRYETSRCDVYNQDVTSRTRRPSTTPTTKWLVRSPEGVFLTATPRLKRHPSMRQNCSALTLASLSGEGSGEGRRGDGIAIPPVQQIILPLIR